MNLALEIEKDYNEKDYPLVRVVLPTQELEPEQATVFIKVIDGFIEQLDLSKVPVNQVKKDIFIFETSDKSKIYKVF